MAPSSQEYTVKQEDYIDTLEALSDINGIDHLAAFLQCSLHQTISDKLASEAAPKSNVLTADSIEWFAILTESFSHIVTRDPASEDVLHKAAALHCLTRGKIEGSIIIPPSQEISHQLGLSNEYTLPQSSWRITESSIGDVRIEIETLLDLVPTSTELCCGQTLATILVREIQSLQNPSITDTYLRTVPDDLEFRSDLLAIARDYWTGENLAFAVTNLANTRYQTTAVRLLEETRNACIKKSIAHELGLQSEEISSEWDQLIEEETQHSDPGYSGDIRAVLRLVSNLSRESLRDLAARFEELTGVAVDVPYNPFPITWSSADDCAPLGNYTRRSPGEAHNLRVINAHFTTRGEREIQSSSEVVSLDGSTRRASQNLLQISQSAVPYSLKTLRSHFHVILSVLDPSEGTIALEAIGVSEEQEKLSFLARFAEGSLYETIVLYERLLEGQTVIPQPYLYGSYPDAYLPESRSFLEVKKGLAGQNIRESVGKYLSLIRKAEQELLQAPYHFELVHLLGTISIDEPRTSVTKLDRTYIENSLAGAEGATQRRLLTNILEFIKKGPEVDVDSYVDQLSYYREGIETLIAARLGISNSDEVQKRYRGLRAKDWERASHSSDHERESAFLSGLLSRSVSRHEFVELPISSHAYMIEEDRIVDKFSLLDTEAKDAIRFLKMRGFLKHSQAMIEAARRELTKDEDHSRIFMSTDDLLAAAESFLLQVQEVDLSNVKLQSTLFTGCSLLISTMHTVNFTSISEIKHRTDEGRQLMKEYLYRWGAVSSTVCRNLGDELRRKNYGPWVAALSQLGTFCIQLGESIDPHYAPRQLTTAERHKITFLDPALPHFLYGFVPYDWRSAYYKEFTTVLHTNLLAYVTRPEIAELLSMPLSLCRSFSGFEELWAEQGPKSRREIRLFLKERKIVEAVVLLGWNIKKVYGFVKELDYRKSSRDLMSLGYNAGNFDELCYQRSFHLTHTYYKRLVSELISTEIKRERKIDYPSFVERHAREHGQHFLQGLCLIAEDLATYINIAIQSEEGHRLRRLAQLGLAIQQNAINQQKQSLFLLHQQYKRHSH